MTTTLNRDALFVGLLSGAAVLLGVLVAIRPAMALGLMGLVGIVALAFAAPVAHLTLLLLVTAIVPYDVQNAYGLTVGGGSAGLLLSDVLLLTGLARATLVLVRLPLDRRRALLGAITIAVFLIAAVQALRGYAGGAALSSVGFELRTLLGFGTLLVAMPVVADPDARERLMKGLLVVGLALGAWGMAQYFGNIGLLAGGDAGVRDNVEFISEARSIQGGLFGFPVAVLLAAAVLATQRGLSKPVRLLLAAVLALNAVSLLLTYERTFWLATVVGFGLILLRAGSLGRLRAIVMVVAALLVALPVLAAVAPSALSAAEARILSVSRYGGGDSLRSRVVESRAVVRRIEEAPFAGSGLADEVRWGMPWLQVPAGNTPFSHNAYLWLVWKLGIPATVLIVGLVAWGVVCRAPRRTTPLVAHLRYGAQASLLMLLIVAFMFPSFSQLAVTPMLGVLLALCFLPSSVTVARAERATWRPRSDGRRGSARALAPSRVGTAAR